MPAVTSIVLFTVEAGALGSIPVTVGTVAMVSLAAGSVVYSQAQARQMQKKARAAMLANQGMTLTSRDSAAQRRLIYGQMRVGGTIVFMTATQPTNAPTAPASAQLVMELRRPTYLQHIVVPSGKSFQRRHGKRMVVAVHEAAHVVFGKLLGVRVRLVSLEGHELREELGVSDMNGTAFFTVQEGEFPAPQLTFAQLVISLAGRVVENWMCGTRIGEFPEIDADTAMKCAVAIAGPRAVQLMDAICLKIFELMGNPLLGEAVLAIAVALHRERQLTEEEIDAIWADCVRRFGSP